MPDTNPRAVIGSNTPDSIDYALEETTRLERDYAELARAGNELITEAEAVQLPIADNDTKGTVTSLIKRGRDFTKRTEGLRELEGQPLLRRKQGVDNFFFRLIDVISKRDRKNRDGVMDTLQSALTEYDNKLLREEQERRRLVAEQAAREAQAAEKKRLDEAAVAEAARLAAERARKPETTAAKETIAQEAEQQASAATVEAGVLADKAEEAYVQTLAKPADIMRSRGADGTLSTMQQEGYAEIADARALDKNELWAFININEKEKALRAWAKSTGYTVMMEGAKIGFRNKSRVR